jgi:small subunit ribosomal protein S8
MSQQLIMLCAAFNQSIINQKVIVSIPASKKLHEFLKLLRSLGFVSDFEIITEKKPYYRIYLIYNKLGYATLRNIYPVSKPSRRIFVNITQLRRLHKSTIILILSTTKGLLTADQALQNNLGGELFCILS